MGKYLDLLRSAERDGDINDRSDKRSAPGQAPPPFSRLCRFGREFENLERRCPEHVSAARWQRCVEDGRRFLATWDEQAGRLGWTGADLFGLHDPPSTPSPSYSRLSRRDCAGLIWILDSRPVVALTDRAAIMKTLSGTLTWRRVSTETTVRYCPNSMVIRTPAEGT